MATSLCGVNPEGLLSTNLGNKMEECILNTVVAITLDPTLIPSVTQCNQRFMVLVSKYQFKTVTITRIILNMGLNRDLPGRLNT